MLVYLSYSDERLLQWLKKDVEGAFYALYERYHHAIYLNIFRVLKNGPEAEDLLQEVFCRLWQKRHSIGADSAVGGWLFLVSYRLTVDHLRLSLKKKKADETFYESGGQELQGRAIDLQLEIMEEAIQQLSPQKRKVFELCKIQGKSYEKAAAEMGITRNTVSDYLKEAMAFIRRYAQQSPYTFPFISGIALDLFLQ